MAIYNLEESPKVFITPRYRGNKFEYGMVDIYEETNSRKEIRYIDLKSDKLVIYGTEIEESKLEKLYESLVFYNTQGGYVVYVNCDGACYFLVQGKDLYRPIHNVIFDWSPFGVIVPNSVNDVLRKQLERKEREIEELQQQLSTFQKDKEDMELKLQKVCTQLSSNDFEQELRKIEFEEQLLTYKKENQNIKIELQTVQDELESSKKIVKNLEEQVFICKKENQDMERELQELQDQVCLANHELQSTKIQLESSERKVDNYLRSIDSDVKSTNQKLDQLLISTLWTELKLQHPMIVNTSSLKGTRYGHSLLPPEDFDIQPCNLRSTHQLPGNSIKSLPNSIAIEEDGHDEHIQMN